MAHLRLVSLYTGAGGLDYGFEAAGFRTCVALDCDHDCCETLRKNRPWPVIESCVEQVQSRQILNTGALEPGEVDLLIGGPPCQPFSKSGYWANGDTKRLDDPRADTLHEYMRCVSDLLPKAFLLENVHGISYSGKEEGFRLLQKLTDAINHDKGTNYQLSWKVLNAVEYGVPQLRRRFFLVAHREGHGFQFPLPTHCEGCNIQGGQQSLAVDSLQSYATAWDAIGNIDPQPEADLRVRGRWSDLLPSIPEGENYLWHTSRKGGLPLFGWRTRFWTFLLKLAKDRPSWTIQAQPGPAVGPFHWENRLLSIHELAALQTFPADIEYVGKRGSVQRQLGNAVPSLLAEVLARAIAKQFFDIGVPGSPRLAVKPNRPYPPPHPVRRVPEKYHHLIGDHQEHPGTGKGNAYRSGIGKLSIIPQSSLPTIYASNRP